MPTEHRSTPPRRRWFRFSLRTLFVVVALVAAPLAWLGVQLKWIHDRNAIVDTFLDRYDQTSFDMSETGEAPWSIRIFGAAGTAWIQLGQRGDEFGEVVDPELVRQFERLYPEAKIEVNDPTKDPLSSRYKRP